MTATRKLARVNAHGVCTTGTTRFVVPMPASIRCHAYLLLARLADGWRVGYDFRSPDAGRGGGPSVRGEAHASREAALAAGLAQAVTFFTEQTARDSGPTNTQAAKSALKADTCRAKHFLNPNSGDQEMSAATEERKSIRKKVRDAEIERSKKPLAKPGAFSGADAAADAALRKELEELYRDRTRPIADREQLAMLIVAIPASVPYTPSERGRARDLIQRLRASSGMPPGLTSTTTPAGIAVNDREALAPMQTTEDRGGSPAKSAEPAWQDGPEGNVIRLDVEDLVRHPDNRVPSKEDVAAMAASLEQVDQLEPIVVWQPLQLAKQGKYQILSGETRWLAHQKIKRPTIQARIAAGIDHAQALELLARFNGERKDLDPIQRAKLAQRLCQPREEGGAGLTTDQAAPQVGLKDGSAVSNLVKVLDLPQVWQERVASGELPHTWARAIIRVATVKPLMESLEKRWADRDKSYSDVFRSRDRLEEYIEDEIDYELVEVSEKQLKDLEPDERKQLGLVELELAGGGRGKSRKATFVTNTEAWEELEEKKAAQRTVKQAATSGRDEPPAKRELSPAEQREKARQRAEQFKDQIAAWRHKLLRKECARLIEDVHADDGRRLVLAYAAGPPPSYYYGPTLGQLLERATGRKHGKTGFRDLYWDVVADLSNETIEEQTWAKMALKLLAHENEDWRRETLPHALVDAYAVAIGAKLHDAWSLVHSDRPLLEAFLQLHRTDELRKQAEEWGITIPQNATKGGMVKLIFSWLTVGNSRRLPVPKSLKPLEERRPSKPKVGKKGGK